MSLVHFLQPGDENAQCYHNVEFDHENHLSHHTRFAWALTKIVEDSSLDPKVFKLMRTPEGTIPRQHDGRSRPGVGVLQVEGVVEMDPVVVVANSTTH